MTLESGRLPAEGVQKMFDRIAPVYDAMNRVMTAGLDRRWRRITIDETVHAGDRMLDACCGTGDLAIAARTRGASAVGLDFSERMLERA
ncbi:MAG TPA: class I SAM-dependent methyltransferase, partial [Gaiellaceae bacterium]